ncbi:hypothetical protein Dimus_039100 [Dionaea muscipula]
MVMSFICFGLVCTRGLRISTLWFVDFPSVNAFMLGERDGGGVCKCVCVLSCVDWLDELPISFPCFMSAEIEDRKGWRKLKESLWKERRRRRKGSGDFFGDSSLFLWIWAWFC